MIHPRDKFSNAKVDNRISVEINDEIVYWFGVLSNTKAVSNITANILLDGSIAITYIPTLSKIYEISIQAPKKGTPDVAGGELGEYHIKLFLFFNHLKLL